MNFLEKNGHGGDLQTAAELFGKRPDEFIDFSANINPLGPPSAVLEQLRTSLDMIQHYPDPTHRQLKKKISVRYSIPPSTIQIGNGAAECMANAILAIRPKSIGIIHPCFSEYEALAHSFDIPVNFCIGTIENQFKASTEDLYALLQHNELVFLGHPNNPTGMLYTKEELLDIAAFAKRQNTYVICDEAFLDFLPIEEQITLLHHLDYFPNVIIIRSMTKFYAIPGLRLGFLVANEEIVSRIKKVQTTWSVNQLALLAGETCLDQKEYERETIEFIQKERAILRAGLEANKQLTVFDGKANFLLVRIKDTGAINLQKSLGSHGILIRSCSMYKGLTEFDFRVAVRTKEENQYLLMMLRSLL